MKRTLWPILAASLLVGCQSSTWDKMQAAHNDGFPEEGAHQFDKFQAAQYASGARHDGMLYPHHFSGPNLNSLGKQKLSLMSHIGDGGFPVVVYMVMPQDALAADRQDAVRHYLKDEGLLDTQIEIRAGANPDTGTSAEAGIEALQKIDPDAGAASAPAPGGAGGGGGAAGPAPSMLGGPASGGK